MINAILVYIIVAAALACIVVSLVLVLGTNQAETEKLSSYECGFEPFGSGWENFDVTFYLVGLLFRIFDIEIAFLFPWAVLVLSGSKARIWLIFVFSLILIVGFVLEMKLGVLDWKFKDSTVVFMLSNCVSLNESINTRNDNV